MSHVVIETTVPVVVTSDVAHEPPVVVNAVQTTTVFVESAPEVIEVNAGPRGLPGPQGPRGEKGEDGGVPEAPLDGAAYARQSGAWVEALPASARGAAGGVASLGANGKLPESQLPAVAITDTYAVADESGMLALDAQRGDIAVRSDINKSFVLQAEPASTLANWLELRTPTDAVLSVAGKTGAVSLVPADITGLDAALANKADNNVALTDAAGTATLPTTTAAPVASRLQVLRNNVKQLFADLGAKLNTDFTSLTTRTIDGTETLALSGGLKATVQAVLDWVLGRANTWTGTQTFAGGVVANGYSTGGVTLKFKLVTVTAGAIGSSAASAAHGLARANIVGFTATLNGGSTSVASNHNSTSSRVFAALNDTDCQITYASSGATEVYKRPVHFLIWYI